MIARFSTRAPLLLALTAAACSSAPHDERLTPPSLVGRYACTGTTSPALGAEGWLDLRDDGTCKIEVAPVPNASTTAETRHAIEMDTKKWPLKLTGHWRYSGSREIEIGRKGPDGQHFVDRDLLLHVERPGRILLEKPFLVFVFDLERR